MPTRARLAEQLIAITVAVLPAWARERYYRELLEEMRTLHGHEQLAYASHVSGRALSLRAAVIAAEHRPPLPWTCRLHLWHSQVWVHSPGVVPYAACQHCGRLAGPTIFDPVR